jgi:manganese/zinc/iron transport system substrate-binding protein
MIKQIITVILLLLTVFSLSACNQTEKDNTKLQIVATTAMIGDVTKNIGGDLVEVKTLMGPGTDPHMYKASERDVRKLYQAKIILYNGLHLEAQLGEVLKQMTTQKVVPVAETIPKENLIKEEENYYDPHVWFNVQYWIEVSEYITQVLMDMDPENKEIYETNGKLYTQQLEELHTYVEEKAAELSPKQRVLITAHDAFGYFGRTYDFEVKGLQGINTEAEAGTADVQELVTYITENEIKAIFIESSLPERNIKAVQDAVRAKGWEVAIGGELFSDAMGSEGTFEGTYIGMVTHNIDTIVSALQ